MITISLKQVIKIDHTIKIKQVKMYLTIFNHSLFITLKKTFQIQIYTAKIRSCLRICQVEVLIFMATRHPMMIIIGVLLRVWIFIPRIGLISNQINIKERIFILKNLWLLMIKMEIIHTVNSMSFLCIPKGQH